MNIDDKGRSWRRLYQKNICLILTGMTISVGLMLFGFYHEGWFQASGVIATVVLFITEFKAKELNDDSKEYDWCPAEAIAIKDRFRASKLRKLLYFSLIALTVIAMIVAGIGDILSAMTFPPKLTP